MLIRIVKALPAPLMDGFDVSGLDVEEVYDVENRLGRYLIVAGYAKALDESVNDKPQKRKTR
jgi:hypothetical protein